MDEIRVSENTLLSYEDGIRTELNQPRAVTQMIHWKTVVKTTRRTVAG
jgi:hypothetical protein